MTKALSLGSRPWDDHWNYFLPCPVKQVLEVPPKESSITFSGLVKRGYLTGFILSVFPSGKNVLPCWCEFNVQMSFKIFWDSAYNPHYKNDKIYTCVTRFSRAVRESHCYSCLGIRRSLRQVIAYTGVKLYVSLSTDFSSPVRRVTVRTISMFKVITPESVNHSLLNTHISAEVN